MNLLLLYPDYVLLSSFFRVLCILCGEKLFKLQCSEKVGTMEIRFLYFYRIP